MFKINVVDGEIYLQIPEREVLPDLSAVGEEQIYGGSQESATTKAGLDENEFLLSDLTPGKVKLIHFSGRRIAVYNVDGLYYATQDECTHTGGPLSEGDLEGKIISCPWHYSCFNVESGEVTCKPAVAPLETFTVFLDGDIGRVEKKF